MGKDRRVKEVWKIEDIAFDRRTLMTLGKLIEDGAFDKLDYIISPGKEASVFRAKSGDSFVAVKIYQNETAHFIKKMDYLVGDPRFKKIKMESYNIIKLFVQKEFKNLSAAEEAGVPAPRPINYRNNILVMSFIGKDGLPFGRMADLKKEVIEEDFHNIIDSVKKLWKAGIVHSDLSEYNVLLGDKPYIIDMSEGVSVRHPKAREFLLRDIVNISAFFKKSLGLDSDPRKIFEKITKGG
jgi:RIO kinase 1